ncbi:DUF982 domain-containing protein [Ensifer soli]|uniref:DUF982 domain-containing protein n=1 Tax=Ciceribacter sp. sgz301302 TaxID=3342379 RepID=UPI0035B99779
MTDLTTDRLWGEPVILEADSRVIRVQSTRDAALCLTNHWPLSEGAALDDALRICEKVLAGDLPPSKARAAFTDAAREANFNVNAWTSV